MCRRRLVGLLVRCLHPRTRERAPRAADRDRLRRAGRAAAAADVRAPAHPTRGEATATARVTFTQNQSCVSCHSSATRWGANTAGLDNAKPTRPRLDRVTTARRVPRSRAPHHSPDQCIADVVRRSRRRVVRPQQLKPQGLRNVLALTRPGDATSTPPPASVRSLVTLAPRVRLCRPRARRSDAAAPRSSCAPRAPRARSSPTLYRDARRPRVVARPGETAASDHLDPRGLVLALRPGSAKVDGTDRLLLATAGTIASSGQSTHPPRGAWRSRRPALVLVRARRRSRPSTRGPAQLRQAAH